MKFFGKFVCVASLIIFASFSAVALDAKVVSFTGKVEVQKDGGWVPVKVGDVLKKGDVVSTGFKSDLVLQINESRVTLGALTRMTVEQLASNDVKDETSLFIDSGKVIADVQHKEKRVSFKVTTPVATASVRGTVGEVRVSGAVTSYEGSFVVSDSNQSEPVIMEDGVSGFIPEAGVTNVFTSASAITSNYGTPVFAGQAVKVDPVAGTMSAPQVEMATNGQPTNLSGTLSAIEGERAPVAEITSGVLQPTAEVEKESSVAIDVGW